MVVNPLPVTHARLNAHAAVVPLVPLRFADLVLSLRSGHRQQFFRRGVLLLEVLAHAGLEGCVRDVAEAAFAVLVVCRDVVLDVEKSERVAALVEVGPSNVAQSKVLICKL